MVEHGDIFIKYYLSIRYILFIKMKLNEIQIKSAVIF